MRVMIRRELDGLTYKQAARAIAGQPFAHLLCGGQQAHHAWGGNWDYIVAAPSQTFEVRAGTIYLDGIFMAATSDQAPFAVLNDLLRARRRSADRGEGYPDFVSGAVGHVSYEMAGYLEPVLELCDQAQANMAFGFYDAVAAWCRETGRAVIFAQTAEAADRLEETIRAPACGNQASVVVGGLRSDKNEDEYLRDVRHCIDQILDGEIFQANLTRNIEVEIKETDDAASSFVEAFDAWMDESASGFAALMQYEGQNYLSNSPERFFQAKTLANDIKVTAEPIKGTRLRSKEPKLDQEISHELLNDKKDRAENIMIADLVRNDLSKVCEDGSIREDKICELQSFAHVHHLVSSISGILRKNKTPLDVLTSSFPCGSITGAPKIRAMEIINEIEKRPREIYCGSIGFFDDRGNTEFSVAIRTAELSKEPTGWLMQYGAGGGITSLSDPLSEYKETDAKAKSLYKLINFMAGRGEKP